MSHVELERSSAIAAGRPESARSRHSRSRSCGGDCSARPSDRRIDDRPRRRAVGLLVLGGGSVARGGAQQLRPHLLLDWRVRKRLEDDLALTLAAHVAVAVWAPFETGYRPEPATASECERLRVSLNRAVSRSTSSDGTQHRRFSGKATRRQSQSSVASDRAARRRRPRFSDWMLAEVRDWVASPGFPRPLAAVTSALLQYANLPGAEVHRLVDEN